MYFEHTGALYSQPKSYLPVLPPDQEPEKFDLALYHSSDSFLHLCTPGPSGEKTHKLLNSQ